MKLFKKYLLFVLCMLVTLGAKCAVFPVLSTGNSGGSTLRNAITQANANGSGMDTISIEKSGVITLQSALPTITSSITIVGLGADVSIIQADTAYNIASYRVLHVNASGVTVVLRDLQIRNGVSTSNGGGVYFQSGDSLHIYDCYFKDNRSTGNSGGGLDFSTGKGLKIYRSAFVGNTQNSNGGAVGIHPSSSSEVYIENCTFSDNEGSSNQVNHGGGALHFYSYSGVHDIDLINCTFDENTLLGSNPNNGKSIFLAAITCTLRLKLLNCILDDHTSGNYAQYTQSGGVITIDRDYTLSSDASITTSGSGNVNNTTNVLDTLATNNGTTPTHALDSNSIAVDAGTDVGAPSEDQRGVPKSGVKDIGAYEYFEQACVAPTFSSTFVVTQASRKYTITNVNIDGQGSVANLNPGQSFTISFNYSIGQNGSYCPGCVVQFYWGVKGEFGRCERSFGGYCNCSGAPSRSFTAPSSPGVYYFTVGQSLLFSCGSNPQNRVSSARSRAFGAIIVGSPVNGNVVHLSGPSEYCPSVSDSITGQYIEGYTCTGNALDSYQWYRGGQAISGATSAKYLLDQEGDYFVKWSNIQGDEVFSDTLEIRNKVHNLNDSSDLELGVFATALTSYPTSVSIPIVKSQSAASYMIIDTLSGAQEGSSVSGTGATIHLAFTPKPNRAYRISATVGGCTIDLDTLLTFSFSNPPLVGTYSIGSSSDFSSFKEFTDSAAIVGVGGDITLEVKDQTFTERVVLNADSMPGYDSTFEFLIHPHPANTGNPVITYASTTSTDNGTFILNGIDNVTLTGLSLKNTGSSYGRVIEVTGGSDHVTILKNAITGPTVTASSSNFANIYSGTSVDNHLKIDSNNIFKGSYGIYIRGSGSNRESGVLIRGNTVKDFHAAGINCWYQDSIKIIGNVIEDKGTGSVVNSITTAVCYYGIEISHNKIVNHSTSAGEGIDVSICYHNASNVGRVYNNAVSFTKTNGGTTRGITISQSAYIKTYHNSVYLNTATSSTDAAGIYVKGTSSYKFNEITNNVVYCADGGYAVHFDATAVSAAVVSNMDNNSLYTNASVFGYFGATSVSDFAGWQSTSSFDANSINLNPYYESDTLLVPQALFMNNLADTSLVSYDLSGVSRPAAPDLGAYEYTPPVPAPDYGDSIGSGRALYFDGVDDYVELGDGIDLANKSFSIEFWAKPSILGPNQYVMGQGINSQHNGLHIGFRSTGRFTFAFFNNDLNTSATYSDTDWQHWACTYDASTKARKIYRNGILVANDVASAHFQGGGSFHIGNKEISTGAKFNGFVDEFRIWDTTLSQNEVRTWMSRKLTDSHPQRSKLVSYYRMDDLSNSTLYDLAGSNTGVLTNMGASTKPISGAALGDTSHFVYGSGASPKITFASGNSFEATSNSGFTATEGIQVYYVYGEPVHNVLPNGVDSILATSGYFGVHKVADASDSYTVTVGYAGLSLSSSQKDRLVLLKRENDADSTWEIASGRIHNVKASNTITIYNQTGTQYVLGFTNTSYENRPGAGYALDFDGVNDNVRIPYDSALNTDVFTVDFWLRRDVYNQEKAPLANRNTNDGTGYSITVISNTLRFWIYNSSSFIQLHGPNIDSLEWMHIACSYDGTNAYMYVNGSLYTSAATTYAPNSGHDIFLGASSLNNNPGWYWDGQMDEVRFWNTALDTNQIRQWMCQKLRQSHDSIPSLVAYYRFDESSGDTLYNLAGSEHGVLTNMTPASDWVISGAAIGDTSVYTTSAPTLLDLTHADGDRMRLSLGGSNQVAHLYMVESAPLHTSLADSLATSSDTSRYWGVFFENEDTALSALTYYYGSNSFFNASNEVNATLLGRTETGTGDWGVVNRPTSLNTGANIVTQSSLQYSQQVIPGTQSTAVYAGFGHAMDFTGGGKHVDFPGETAFDFTDSLSFEAWVYVTSATNQLFHNGGSNGDPGYAIRFFAGSIRIEFRNGSVMHLDYPYAPYMNEWHHWAVTWSKTTNEVKLYIDGEWVKTSNFYNSLPAYSGDPALGAKSDGSGGFGGYLDEVRIWNRTLTADEIRANYKVRIDSTADGLVAYFNFDDQNNPVLYDYSGNGNNGVLDGGLFTEGQDSLSFSISELASTGDTVGFAMGWDRDGETLTFKEISGDTAAFDMSSSTGLISVSSSASFNYSVNPTYIYTYEVTKSTSLQKDTATVVIELFEQAGSLHFDGSNDFVEVDGATELDFATNSDFTIEQWVLVDNLSAGRTFSHKGHYTSANDNSGWSARVETDGSIRWYVEDDAETLIQTSAFVVTTNVWYHIAMVYKDSLASIYVNGNLEASGVAKMGSSSSENYFIGRRNHGTPSKYFSGQLDEIRIWNRALCAEELGHRKTCQLDTTDADGVIAYYSFNQGAARESNSSIDSLIDGAGNGLNGVLNNFAKNGNTSNWLLQSDSITSNSCGNYTPSAGPEITVLDTTIYLDATGNASINASFLIDSITEECSEIAFIAVGSDTMYGVGDGGNYFNGIYTGGLADIVEVTGNNATNYRGASFGTQCSESWYPRGTLCDEGTTADSPDSSYKSNTNSGATWYNPSPGTSYGILVIDMGQVAHINEMSVFQMFSDGKTTAISVFASSELGATPPTAAGGTWTQLVNKESVGAGVGIANYATQPTKISFANTEARYFKIYAYNDGSLGNSGYIELRSIKAFGGSATLNYSCADTGTQNQTFVVGDDFGNTTSASAQVTVLDTIAPTLVVNNYTAYLDAAGNATIYSDSLIESVTDNCNGYSISVLSDTSFSCQGLPSDSIKYVQIEIEDFSGNTTLDSAKVIVLDSIPPVVTLRDDTLYLDESGNTDTLSVHDLVVNASDNCVLADTSLLASINYDCSAVGAFSCEGALAFDGNNDVVRVPDNSALDALQDMTVEFWVNPQTISTWDALVWRSDAGAWNTGGWGLYFNGGQIHYFVNSYQNGSVINSPSTIPTNAWTHVAAVYNGARTKLYINGEAVDSANFSAAVIPTNYKMNIGSTGASSSYSLHGQLDEVRVWGVERTEAEIASSMNQCLTGRENALVAYFPFNDGSGGVAQDYSPNGMNGTLTNMNTSAAWQSSGISVTTPNVVSVTVTDSSGNATTEYSTITFLDTLPPSITFGGQSQAYLDSSGNATVSLADLYSIVDDNCTASPFVSASDTTFSCSSPIDTLIVIDGALSFDGTNDYVNVPHDASLNPTSEITVEAWIKPNNLSSTQKIVGKCENGLARDGWVLGTNGSGKITAEFYASNWPAGNVSLPSSSSLTTGTWTHVAMSRKTSGKIRIYINGVLTDSSNATGFDLGTDVNDMHIGIAPYNTTQYFFNGEIGEVRVWDTERTPAQIASNYLSRLSGTESGLQAYYTFDSGVDTVVVDRSGNANDGAMISMDVGTDWVAGRSDTIYGTPVEITVEDASGNQIKDSVLVELIDTLAPIIVAKQDTVYLDASGVGNTTLTRLYANISDNCVVSDISVLGDTTFACNDINKANYVAFSAIDLSENERLDSSLIVVLDTISPVVTPIDDTLYLNAAGFAVIDTAVTLPGGIFGGNVSDNCAPDSMWFSQDTFRLAHFGANTVVAYVRDSSGNVGSNTFTIWLLDSARPMAGIHQYWNSTADQIKIASETSIAPDGNDPFTIEMWVNPSNLSVRSNLLWKGSGSSGSNSLQIWASIESTGNVRLGLDRFSAGGWGFFTSQDTLPLDMWSHVAFVKGVGADIRVYINGHESNTSISGSTAFTSATASNGTFDVSNTSISKIGIDEVRFWNEKRTEAEIREFMFKPLKGGEANLAFYLPFERVNGSVIADESGNDRNSALAGVQYKISDTLTTRVLENSLLNGDVLAHLGGFDLTFPSALSVALLSGNSGEVSFDSLTGALTVADASAFDYETNQDFYYTYEVTDTAGLKDSAVFHIQVGDEDEFTYAGLGNAAEYNNTTKYIEVDSLPNASTFTIEAWIKPQVHNSINTLFANRASGQSAGISFDINTWTTLDRKLLFSKHTSGLSSDAGLIKDDEWQHVAVSVDGTNAFLFYNGEIVASTTSLSGTNNGLPLRIGLTKDNAYTFDGSIDEVRVWSVARDSNEIRENYRKRVAPNASGLVTYLNFETESGFPIRDIASGSFASTFNFNGNEWHDAQDTLPFEMVEHVNPINSNYIDQTGDTIAWFMGYDNDESFEYSLLQSLPTAFGLDTAKGTIFVVDHTQINFEVDSSYVIPYTATGISSGSVDTAAIEIEVLDIYEPPIVNLPIVETFDGTSSQGWTFSGANGGNFRPSGWLRLTDNGGGRFGIAFYDTAFYANSGIHVAFDYATYGGSGADGFTFFLFDGYAGNPTPGAAGGPLGYGPYNLGPTPGLSDAYLGVAFDEYGNFTNTTGGTGGLAGLRPDQVAIRGSGNGMSGYQFHTNEQINTAAHGFSTIDGVSRANKRRVFLYFVNEKVTVRMDLNGDRDGEDPGELIINEFDLASATNQDSLPDLLKFGFSAATGGLTNYHEIDSLVVTQPGDVYSTFSTLPDHLSEGDTLTYFIKIKNTDINDINAQAGYFEHEIPDVTQYVSSTISAPGFNTLAYSNDTISGTFNLDVLDSITIDVKVVLDTNLNSSLLLASYVELSDAFTDVNPADNFLSDSINIHPLLFSDADTISEFAIANDTLISPNYRNAETWQSLTFTQLPNSYNGTFAVNDSTGVITVAKPDSIDFEKIAQYTINVEIMDTVGGRDTAQFTINIADEIEDVYAGFGRSLLLDGVNDEVVHNGQIIQTTQPFTVSIWAKNTAAPAGFREIISQGGLNTRWYIGSGLGGELRVGDGWLVTGVNWPTDTLWHNYAVVSSASNVYLYLDGDLVAERGSAYGADTTSTSQFRIGNQYDTITEYYNGAIDEVKVWNRPLDSLEVLKYMNKRPDTHDPSLVLYYPMDEIGDDRVLDYSGNDYHGTLLNTSGAQFVRSADTLQFLISEGLAMGDTAAYASAWDSDSSEVIYSILSGNTNGTFELDSATGEITVANPSTLFYYLDSIYTISYAVDELGDDQRDTASIRIKLINENEAPLISSISGDTVCAGTWSDSLDFTITDVDPEDSASVLQLLAFASDSVAIPSDSIRFYGSDSTRKVVVSLPHNREVFESVDVTVVVSDLVGATDTSVFTLLIDTFPVPIIDTLPSICRLSTPIDLTPYVNLTSGGVGVWSGQGVSGSNFVPVAAAGAYPVNYEFTDAFGCTSDTTADITIDPKPNATLSQFALFCDNSSIDTLRQGTPVGGIYFGTGVSGDSLFDPTIGVGSYTINYTFENVFECADTAQRVLEVRLAPTASMSALPNQCVSADPLVLNQASPVLGGVGVYSGNGVTNNVFYPQIADTGTHTLKYVFTDTLGCMDSAFAPIVVDTLPFVSVSSIPAVCNNAATISLSQGMPLGGSYSGLGVSGGLFDPAQVNAGTNVIRYTYTDGNGCTDSSDALVTVHPVTQASIAAVANRCDNDLPFTLNTGAPSGGHYAGAGVMNDSVSFNPKSVASGTHTIRYVYQNNYGCYDSANANIVIDTLPIVGFSGGFANVCANEDTVALTLGTPVTQGSGYYYGNGVVNDNLITSLSGVGTQQVSYVFEDLNGCRDTSTQAIVVDTIPVVSLSSFSAYCLNEPSFVLNGGQPQVGGTGVYNGTGVGAGSFDPSLADTGSHTVTYTFTDGNGCSDSASQDILVQPLPNTTFTLLDDSICISDAAISLSNGLPSGGQYSGSGVTGLIFNPANAGVGDAEITYEYIDTNGCHNNAVDTMHVIGLPAVSYVEANPSICEGGLSFALSGALPSGGVFSHPTSGVVDASGNFNPVVAGVGEHIVSYSVEQFGCSNTAKDTVTVHALPNVSFAMQQQFCNNGDSISISGGAPSGGVYSGPGVSGSYFNPVAAGSGTHVVAYTVTTSEGCKDSATVPVTIHTKPTVTFASFADMCAYEQPVLLTQGAPSGVGGTYYNSNGNAISQFDPGQYNIGSEQLKYVYEDANGCQDSAFHTTQVKAAPNVFFSAIPDQCENGAAFTLFHATGVPAGGTGVYSGNGVTANTYNPSLAGLGVHSVNYTYTASNGCVDSVQQTVVVDSVPIVTFSGVRDFCSNEPSYTLTEGLPKTGGTGVYSGSGVIGTEFFPSFAGFGSQVLTYEFTDANGCTGVDTDTIHLKSSPQVNLFGANNVCDSAPNITLSLHSVAAGQGFGYYSGPGVVGVDTFNSALAGPGIHNLYYVYQDTSNGFVCADSALTNITVNPKPQPTVVSSLNACLATSTVFLNNAAPSGGLYLDSSFAGIQFNQFKPADYGLGTHKLFYEYTNLYGCKDTLQTSIDVYNSPSVSFEMPNASVCIDGNSVALSSGQPAGGVYAGLGVFGSNFIPSLAGLGQQVLSYTYADSNSCSGTAYDTVNVTTRPTISVTSDTLVCEGNNAVLYANSSDVNASYLWSTGASTSTIQIQPVVSTNYRVTISSPAGCTEIREIQVDVVPGMQLFTSSSSSECGDAIGELNTTVIGGQAPYKYQWTTGHRTAQVVNVPGGLYEVTVTDSRGCKALASHIVTNDNGPEAQLVELENVSCYGEQNGVIEITTQGGQGNLTINWSNGAQTERIENLDAGIYEVLVSDEDDCINVFEYQITEPSALIALVDTVWPTCGNSDGEMALNVAGGTAPYDIRWNDADTQAVRQSMPSGIYGVSIVDTNGCRDSITVALSEINGPTIALTQEVMPSCDKAEGLLAVSILTDSLQSLTWNNGDTTFVSDSLEAGEYTLSAVDTSGCQSHFAHILLPLTPSEKQTCLVTVDTSQQRNVIVWEEDTLIQEVNIYRLQGDEINPVWIGRASQSDGMFIDNSVSSQIRPYRYRIEGLDSCGNSSVLSQEMVGLHVSALAVGQSVEVNWTDAPQMQGSQYVVYRTSSSRGKEYLGTVSYPGNQFVDNAPLFNAGELYYHVEASDESMCSAHSSFDRLVSNYSLNLGNNYVGLSEWTNSTGIALYPNPNNGSFVIRGMMAIAQEVTVEVVSVDGRKVFDTRWSLDKGGYSKVIKLETVESGVYFLRLSGEGDVVVKQFVVK